MVIGYLHMPRMGCKRGEVNLGQSRTDPCNPPLAKAGMVSRPPAPVDRGLSVGSPTNRKVSQASIHTLLPLEISGSKLSCLEIVCRSNQARGSSEQVSNRIPAPQRKFTLDLLTTQEACRPDSSAI